MRKSLFIWTLLPIFAFSGAAKAFDPPEVRSLGEDAPKAEAVIADVSFLTGHWIGEGLGGCAEEFMAPAAGGQIMGMFRQMNEEGVLRFYEFYTIAELEGSLVLRIKHFNPDLTGWEEKDETVAFPLVAVEGTTVYFDRLTFSRRGKKGFASAVMIEERGIAAFDMRAARKGESCNAQ